MTPLADRLRQLVADADSTPGEPFALEIYPDDARAVLALLAAVRRLTRDGCEHVVTGIGSCYSLPGQYTDDAPGWADRICDPCRCDAAARRLEVA